jgi:hypothetical protein
MLVAYRQYTVYEQSVSNSIKNSLVTAIKQVALAFFYSVYQGIDKPEPVVIFNIFRCPLKCSSAVTYDILQPPMRTVFDWEKNRSGRYIRLGFPNPARAAELPLSLENIHLWMTAPITCGSVPDQWNFHINT